MNPTKDEASELLAREKLNRLASAIAVDFATALSPGDVADLRRLDPVKGTRCPAFWKIAVERLEPAGFDFDDPEARWDERWAAVLQVMALLHGLPGRPHRLGAALAAAGVSEARVMRLLRSQGPALYDGLRMTARQLASAAVPVYWADLAEFVLADAFDADRERVRRNVARDFYRQLSINTRQEVAS